MAEPTHDDLAHTFATIVDEAHGKVTLDGHAFVLVKRETLAEIQRSMEEILGRGTEGILLRAGHTWGAQLSARLAALTKGSARAFIEAERIFMARTGLCHLEDCRVDGPRATVRVSNSFIGIAYGRSPRPVCHYLRGFVLAWVEHLVGGRNFVSVERTCAAMGNGACVFEIAPGLGSEIRRQADADGGGDALGR